MAVVELINGSCGVPELITTFVVLVGTPHIQLEASLQLELEVPSQTPAEPIVTVVADELVMAHAPLWTIALNWVVCVNVPEV